MAGPNWSTIWRQSLRSCLIALRAICRCDFAQLKLLLAYLFVLFGYLYCLLTCDNSLMLFAKLTNSSDIAMKYAEKHKTRNTKRPGKRGSLVGAFGVGEGLVQADARYIGGLDGRGMVGLVFGEGDGEVLDTVGRAEFFEEQDELTQFFNEPVLIFDRGDGDEHHHVVGEVVEAVRVREDNKRGRK